MEPAIPSSARERAAGRVFIVTGAGVSADSGIPTFRGAGGLWRQRDPMTLATPEAFEREPDTVLEWYAQRRRQVHAAEPNAGHRALVALARGSSRHLLLTQNVDDLHERAGADRAQLVHIHGRLFLDRCARCPYSHEAEHPFDPPGRCPRCGARLRPGVVWFGERLAAADIWRVESFLQEGPLDLVVSVGTTASFGYIVDWVARAASFGAWHVDVNPEGGALAEMAHESHRASGAEILPALFGLPAS